MFDCSIFILFTHFTMAMLQNEYLMLMCCVFGVEQWRICTTLTQSLIPILDSHRAIIDPLDHHHHHHAYPALPAYLTQRNNKEQPAEIFEDQFVVVTYHWQSQKTTNSQSFWSIQFVDTAPFCTNIVIFISSSFFFSHINSICTSEQSKCNPSMEDNHINSM